MWRYERLAGMCLKAAWTANGSYDCLKQRCEIIMAGYGGTRQALVD